MLNRCASFPVLTGSDGICGVSVRQCSSWVSLPSPPSYQPGRPPQTRR